MLLKSVAVATTYLFCSVSHASDYVLEDSCPSKPAMRDVSDLKDLIWRQKYGVGYVVLRMHDLATMARVGGFSIYQREALDNELKALLDVLDSFELIGFSRPLRPRSQIWFRALVNRESLGLSSISLRGDDVQAANMNAEAAMELTGKALRKLGRCS